MSRASTSSTRRTRSRTWAISTSSLSGRAQVSTRIPLADTQKVVAIAPSLRRFVLAGHAEIVVTLAACTEEMN